MSEFGIDEPPVIASATYRRSNDIAELFAAKAKAQALIENAQKDAKNPHFNSKYATLASVSDACLHPLAEHGISVWQFPANSSDDSLSVTTLFGHASGQWIESTLSVKLAKADAQALGSATTYLRKYALAAFAMVAPEDDDGNAAAAAAAPQRQIATPAAPKTTHPAVVARDRILAAIQKAKTLTELRDIIEGPDGTRDEVVIKAAKGGEDAWTALMAHARIKNDELETVIRQDVERRIGLEKPFFYTYANGNLEEFADPIEATENFRGYTSSEAARAGTDALAAAWERGAQLMAALRERGCDELADSCVRTYEIQYAKAQKAEAKERQISRGVGTGTADPIGDDGAAAEDERAGAVAKAERALDEPGDNVVMIDNGVPILAAALQEKIEEKVAENFRTTNVNAGFTSSVTVQAGAETPGIARSTPAPSSTVTARIAADGTPLLYPEKADGWPGPDSAKMERKASAPQEKPYDVKVLFGTGPKAAEDWFKPAKAKLIAMLDGDRQPEDFKRFRVANDRALQVFGHEMRRWAPEIEKLIVAGETRTPK